MANLGVASQLELLKGFHQDLGFSSEDEVEVPDFQERNLDYDKNDECNDSICHPDGWISDVKKGRKIPSKSTSIGNSVSEMLDHYTKGNEKQSEPCTFSGIDTEANRKDTCCPFSSKDKYTGKGNCEKFTIVLHLC